jgi:divalent metal cation (Fe/Co/Zn/Cd) transporter
MPAFHRVNAPHRMLKSSRSHPRTQDVGRSRTHPIPLNGIISCMATVPIATHDTLRSVRRVQGITIAWMAIEAVLSLWSAWTARSPALAAFGGDSAVELLSAIVVLWRFRGPASEQAERSAARIAGGLLFFLAVFVVAASGLSLRGYSEPRPSYLGMAVLAAAALIMPWLTKEKRRLSALTGSAALRADAAESALCAYLSIIALAGLAAHALWHVEWADPVAALAITPFIAFEAREAIRGKPCRCCEP